MAGPAILRGATAIGACLGISAKETAHLERQRRLPTFYVPQDSAPYATVGGLHEWRQLSFLSGISDKAQRNTA